MEGAQSSSGVGDTKNALLKSSLELQKSLYCIDICRGVVTERLHLMTIYSIFCILFCII